MSKKKFRIFPKPVGPSEKWWNNLSMGTLASITCEVCGTMHRELPSDQASRIVDRFLGLQMVEECCGRAIDVLYQEFGGEFCVAFLHDFAKDPKNPRFGILKFALEGIVKDMQRTVEDAKNAMSKLEKLSD